MNKELAKTIGTGARQARKALQLTQEDIAERVGVSVEFYARIERGTSLPSIVTFARIATALGASGDMLLGRHHAGVAQTGTWVAPQVADKPEIRRIVRRLRSARSGTLRLVSMLLKEFESLDEAKAKADTTSGGTGTSSSEPKAPLRESGSSSDDSDGSSAQSPARSAESDADLGADDGNSDDSAPTPVATSDDVIAASKVLGTDAPGMRAMASSRRVFAYGSTSSAVGE